MTARMGGVGVIAPALELYEETKAELEAMEYTEFLGLDSMPLVRKLLDDLMLTTESHGKQQGKIMVLNKEIGLAQEQLFGIRRENARLVRENNQLHMEMIRAKEELDEKARTLDMESRSTKDKLAEASFLANQWKERLDKAERSLEALRSGAGDLSEKIINTEANSFSASQSENTTEHASRESEGPSTTAELQQQAASLARESAQMKEELEHQKSKVFTRDEEIARLASELEKRGWPEDKVPEDPSQTKLSIEKSTRTDLDSGNQVQLQLYEQIDFLTGQLSEQAKKLEKASLDAKLLDQLRADLDKKEKELQAALMQLGDDKKSAPVPPSSNA
eukprot:CAMPEP_0184559346 /NCGR_PEP_ID=MMETSP0199_2-20130426/46382_1 /TAXON_ID=1112570 /ORGANISM="Thraustochytrium sp., Strain LLF1b" /LENGTH=333 /DNA_ID=CAMNT_0026956633 /DNA_START=68 /DNA_END=1066 /DNA_ORIENTATION=-